MSDTLTEKGALKLALAIRDYWQSRGKTVKVRVEKDLVTKLGIYVVRSDLINGVPRKVT